jgi:hypothetical protein
MMTQCRSDVRGDSSFLALPNVSRDEFTSSKTEALHTTHVSTVRTTGDQLQKAP